MQRMAIPALTADGAARDLKDSIRASPMFVGIGTRLSAIVETAISMAKREQTAGAPGWP
ncbi:MAG TPA: hypothetical protein VIY51_24775 [Xanthobacteraceae bacterium]